MGAAKAGKTAWLSVGDPWEIGVVASAKVQQIAVPRRSVSAPDAQAAQRRGFTLPSTLRHLYFRAADLLHLKLPHALLFVAEPQRDLHRSRPWNYQALDHYD